MARVAGLEMEGEGKDRMGVDELGLILVFLILSSCTIH